jgi:hypothetical protein
MALTKLAVNNCGKKKRGCTLPDQRGSKWLKQAVPGMKHDVLSSGLAGAELVIIR